MFASLFQECGFHKVPLDEEFSISMLHGPSSISSPMEDEQPGPAIGSPQLVTSHSLVRFTLPPLIHIITSSANVCQLHLNYCFMSAYLWQDLYDFQRSRRTDALHPHRRQDTLYTH